MPKIGLILGSQHMVLKYVKPTLKTNQLPMHQKWAAWRATGTLDEIMYCVTMAGTLDEIMYCVTMAGTLDEIHVLCNHGRLIGWDHVLCNHGRHIGWDHVLCNHGRLIGWDHALRSIPSVHAFVHYLARTSMPPFPYHSPVPPPFLSLL